MAICDEGLAKIGAALKAHQEANGGRYPERLEALVEGSGELTVWDLVCPGGPDAVGECSYTYRGGDLDCEADGEMVVAYCREPWHKGRRNVLFADGRTERPPEGVLESWIRRDNRLRREAGLDEKFRI